MEFLTLSPTLSTEKKNAAHMRTALKMYYAKFTAS